MSTLNVVKNENKILQKKQGFILITILVILGLSYFLFDRVITSTTLFSTFYNNYEKEIQMKQLIFLGIATALSEMIWAEDQDIESSEMTKIVVTEKNEKNPEEPFKKSIDTRLRSFFYFIIPKLNNWNKFELKEDIDGISATIKTCLTCEEGKLFLPDVFDFEKNELNPSSKEIIKSFKFLSTKTNNEELEKILLNFIKNNHQKPFCDLSQLDLGQELSFFYEPLPEKKDKSWPKLAKEIFIADLFTLFSIDNDKKTAKLNPFFLSYSLLKIMEKNIPQDNADAKKNLLVRLKKTLEKLSFKTTKDDSIKMCKEIYNFENNQKDTPETSAKTIQTETTNESSHLSIESLKQFFTDKIEPELFSLNCQAEFSGQTKKAVIIFRRTLISEKYKDVEQKINPDAPENKKLEEKKDDTLFLRNFFLPDGFEIIRFYWL